MTASIDPVGARVEAHGAIDELNTVIGLARTQCDDPEIRTEIGAIQQGLFLVDSAVSTRPEANKPIPEITKAMVQRNWSIPGEFAGSAAFDVARAICRRAQRTNVRYVTSGGVVQPTVLECPNRLSDLLWLCAPVIEARNSIDARLRDEAHVRPPWSRAW
jgi:cob(I)alamin adenosyltransferase